MSYSEDLFAANACSSDSFFDFAQKVLGVLPDDPSFGVLRLLPCRQQCRLPTYDVIKTAPYVGSSLSQSLAALSYA